jgi:acetyl esterase
VKERLMRLAVRAGMASDRFVRFAGRKRANGVDAILDRQVAAALEFQRVARLPALDSMEPEAARRFAEEGLSATELDLEPMEEVIDTTLGHDRIPARIFVPRGASGNWIVWFHGGGGVIGSIAASEAHTRFLAAHTHCTVASIGYRLGPEDKHPAAIEDACEAYEAILERVPARGRVAVGGDSFGGFLAAHVDGHTRAAKIRRPDLQILVYPLLDLTLVSPSIERYAEGYLLTKSMMHWFRNHYLHADDDREAGSPWFWKDVTGSAQAIIVTAGFDPLVDEGDAWVTRLRSAGCEVRHHRHDSLVHGFLSLAGAVRAARVAVDRLCVEIVEALA